MSDRSRRRFLKIAGAASVAGLAGCSGEIDGSDRKTDIKYPPAEVAAGLWKSQDRSVVNFDRTALKGEGAARTYRNTRVTKRIKKLFAGQFSQPLTTAYGIHLKYEGAASTAVTAGKILDEVRTVIVERLKKRGLTQIQTLASEEWESDDLTDPDQSLTGTAYNELIAVYPAPEQQVSFGVTGYGEQSLTFPKRQVNMRVPLLVRDLTTIGLSGEAYVLGGVYPETDYTNEAQTTLKQQGNASITLTVELDTSLSPGQIRQELVNQFIGELVDQVT